MNKDMSMTIAHFVNSDNVHVIEESKAAEIDAAEKEWAEEKNDRAVDGHLPYEEFTGDYRDGMTRIMNQMMTWNAVIGFSENREFS